VAATLYQVQSAQSGRYEPLQLVWRSGQVTKIDEALTDTIADMIRNSVFCGCCDSDGNHAALIKRALQRTPVDWWPNTPSIQPFVFDALNKNTLYIPILQALTERRITWTLL
jgi:hypothetical protein